MLEKKVLEFISESNYIEREWSEQALVDGILAWSYAYAQINSPLTIETILEIHRILLWNISPDIAGRIRDCDVFIGGKRKVFISEFALKMELTKFIKSYEKIRHKKLSRREVGPNEKSIKDNHVLFESIHPFCDGNGRVGRILYNMLRVAVGLPIHVIVADWPDVDGSQAEYYSWFNK